MQISTTVAIALTLFIAVQSAPVSIPSRCNVPSQWEARRVAFDPNERRFHNHSSEYHVMGRYAYDAKNQRKARVDDGEWAHETQGVYFVLELHEEKVWFVENIKTKECECGPITWPFHSHSVPEAAKFVGYEIIGSGSDSLELSQWVWDDDMGHHYMTVTKE